jgi:hypothetical protein
MALFDAYKPQLRSNQTISTENSTEEISKTLVLQLPKVYDPLRFYIKL